MTQALFIIPTVGLILTDDEIPAPGEGTATFFGRPDGTLAAKLPDGSVVAAGGGAAGGGAIPVGGEGAIIILDKTGKARVLNLGTVGQILGIPVPELGTDPLPGWIDFPEPDEPPALTGQPGAVVYFGADGKATALPPGQPGQVLAVGVSGDDGVCYPQWTTLAASTGGGTGGGGTGGGGGGGGTPTTYTKLAGTFAADSVYTSSGSDYSVANATDGNLATHFSSASSVNGWLSITLPAGQTAVLAKVRVAGYDSSQNYSSNLVVEALGSDGSWVQIGTTGVSQPSAWTDNLIPATTAANAFRLRNPGDYLALCEVEFYA